jgi:hypothetical protein
VLAGVLSAAAPASVVADPVSSGGREVWAGADVSANVWLLYSGATFAPWSGIHDEGIRFRTAGGYGRYEYAYDRGDAGKPDIARFAARTHYADVLVGYLARFGELTAKGFVGLSIVGHEIAPWDARALNVGDEIGPKGVVELWLNMGERGWGQLDLSWTSAHDTRAARARVGYRVWPHTSLGLEAGINVDEQADCRRDAKAKAACFGDTDTPVEADLLDYARAGAFARYEWETGEVSLAAGVLGTGLSRDDTLDVDPYVTLNWLTQF